VAFTPRASGIACITEAASVAERTARKPSSTTASRTVAMRRVKP
jgi:hypothetical protein